MLNVELKVDMKSVTQADYYLTEHGVCLKFAKIINNIQHKTRCWKCQWHHTNTAKMYI